MYHNRNIGIDNANIVSILPLYLILLISTVNFPDNIKLSNNTITYFEILNLGINCDTLYLVVNQEPDLFLSIIFLTCIIIEN